MDHSGHGDMGGSDPHAGHPGMGGGGGPPRCSMNMLFTWNTDNLCIVFRQWRIDSTFTLVVSLLAIVALAAGYEALREGIRQYEAWTNKRVETAPRKFPRCSFISSHLNLLSCFVGLFFLIRCCPYSLPRALPYHLISKHGKKSYPQPAIYTRQTQNAYHIFHVRCAFVAVSYR